MNNVLKHCAVAAGLVVLYACANNVPDSLDGPKDYGPVQDDPTKDPGSVPAPYAGGESNTFSHQGSLGGDSVRDPFDILKQRQEEGPPEIRTRLHSCQKLQIAAIRNMLEGFGVDLSKSGDPPTAGDLLNGGTGALGAANYDARVGEALVWSSAGAAKLFDIFVQAAPEIIANLPNAPSCQVDGKGPDMFDAQNRCSSDAVTCLIGRPVTKDELAICDSLVQSATTIDNGKAIAVATMMSAAHSCE